MFEIIFAIIVATPICIYSAIGIARGDDRDTIRYTVDIRSSDRTNH